MKRKTLVVAVLALFLAPEALALRYNWKYNVTGMVTRCFDARSVHVQCDGYWDDTEGKRKRFEELLIDVGDDGDDARDRYSYGYSSMIEGPLCREHLRKIKRLMRKVDQVCITGEGEDLPRGSHVQRWEALETKRGEVHR